MLNAFERSMKRATQHRSVLVFLEAFNLSRALQTLTEFTTFFTWYWIETNFLYRLSLIKSERLGGWVS